MNTLQSEIRAARERKGILLMTHLVLGYPSLDVNREVIRQMVDNGVDLMEMQIPFSEPVADGPVISRACQEAIAGGVTVRQCLAEHPACHGQHITPVGHCADAPTLFNFTTPQVFPKLHHGRILRELTHSSPPHNHQDVKNTP